MKDINSIAVLSKSDLFKVYIKNNCQDDILTAYAKECNLVLLDEMYGLGFGANNNYLYNYVKTNGLLQDDDFIIVLNPDIYIDSSTLFELISRATLDAVSFATINLYKDINYSFYDNSIRKWPTLLSFVTSFLIGKNNTIIDKNLIDEPVYVDWAAGSFLAIKSSVYNSVNGFDESYFMYCEDVDICYRINKIGIKLRYYPDLKALHLAAHKNRNIFSKHFFWHVKSIIRFLMKR
ncbi:glycosyltransferase family 2 protein [Buttiauxella sp. A2-C2_NF]|uniref:glycosyltransferase family 2 protein n=1 Tax=Buttiauxella ferragutiae TaxID=82989 RepID=UPI001E45B80F|nr:glycosyltransferase family 2 protein [Buttiauxella ferragutiae]MCE0826701.1 glycosyltransferase family 2 protein [Buttiauxella ferragutiae]